MALTFAIVGFVTTVALNPQVDKITRSLFLFEVAFAWILNGYALAFAISLLTWIGSVDTYQPLRLNLIPARTFGLRSASELAGQAALLFTIQTVLEIVVFLLIDWSGSVAVTVVIYGMMIPLAVLGLGLLFYPQLKLRDIVVTAKRETLCGLEREIHAVQNGKLLPPHERLGVSLRLLDLHSRITKSPSSPADLGTIMQYASSVFVAISSLFINAQQIRNTLQQVIRWP